MKIKNLISQIDNVSFQDSLGFVTKTVKENTSAFVVTINTEIVMHARKDPEYEKILKSANLIVNDSIGIKWARGMFGISSKERVHGSDLLESLAKKAGEDGLSLGLLGARSGVVEKTAEVLKKIHPNLKIAFAFQEWPVSNQPKCDILFVAFGSPKQEKWIYENIKNIDVKVAIGVGGAFDFVSGNVKRAPEWIRKIGLEWVFRLLIQPWRIKRQLAIPQFVLIVLKEKVFG